MQKLGLDVLVKGFKKAVKAYRVKTHDDDKNWKEVRLECVQQVTDRYENLKKTCEELTKQFAKK